MSPTWKQVHDDDEVVRKIDGALTEDEIVEVREGLRILRAFQSFGLLGTWVKNVLIWCGIVIGAWLAFNEWVLKFIRAAVNAH